LSDFLLSAIFCIFVHILPQLNEFAEGDADANRPILWLFPIITARCTVVQSAVLRLHVVCLWPSVC